MKWFEITCGFSYSDFRGNILFDIFKFCVVK